MVNVNKRKGSNWEREAAKLLVEKLNGSWKRVIGSGAFGTLMNDPSLTGDIVGKLNSFPRGFRLEAKVGYGGATQLTIKKEWLDKIKEEAENTYSIPGLVCKFSGAHGENKYFIVLDLDTFIELILNSERLWDELNEHD